jgi:PhnB protein
MIAYEDGPKALAWLASAFGFVERARMVDATGRLTHGEMETDGGGMIMLATPSADYEGPKRHRTGCESARRWHAVPWVIDGVLVYVDAIDEHFAKAKTAGATMLSEIEEGFPGRRYRVEDLEGHRWMFMQRE